MQKENWYLFFNNHGVIGKYEDDRLFFKFLLEMYCVLVIQFGYKSTRIDKNSNIYVSILKQQIR